MVYSRTIDEESELKVSTVLNPPKKRQKQILEELSTEGDMALNNMIAEEREKELAAQRALDADADYRDTHKVELRHIEITENKNAATIAEQGPILANGRPANTRRLTKPAVDPARTYTNYPIKTIDNTAVLFLGSRPWHDKLCEWDEQYRDQTEHFLECDHPMYFGASICKIKYLDHYKKTLDAWVIRTDEEIQLFIKK